MERVASSSPLFVPDESPEINGEVAHPNETEDKETPRTTPEKDGYPAAVEAGLWRDWNEMCLPKIFAGFTVTRDVELVRSLSLSKTRGVDSQPTSRTGNQSVYVECPLCATELHV